MNLVRAAITGNKNIQKPTLGKTNHQQKWEKPAIPFIITYNAMKFNNSDVGKILPSHSDTTNAHIRKSTIIYSRHQRLNHRNLIAITKFTFKVEMIKVKKCSHFRYGTCKCLEKVTKSFFKTIKMKLMQIELKNLGSFL